MTRIPGLACAALLLALLTPASASSVREDLVPITQRAIAAVALERLPTNTTGRQAMYTHQRVPDGTLGADLRYDGDGEYDGDLVRIAVGPRRKAGCSEHTRCVALASPPGTTTTLVWATEVPEEDPGFVAVVFRHDAEQVSVHTSGDTITRDPRQQRLQFPVEVLAAVAQDPRLRLMTTQAVVDAGAALPLWEGGEPDPLALSIVPSSDRALAAAYLLSRGGYGEVSRISPSPLRGRFGRGTLGARLAMKRGGGIVDVLAIPRAPAWMRHPCRSRFAPDHCLVAPRSRGPVRFAWRPSSPGTPGETWTIHRRAAETVAIRTAGYPVPRSREDATAAADWYSQRRQVVRRTFGLTTTKETADDRTATRRWRG